LHKMVCIISTVNLVIRRIVISIDKEF
jgi:hypothetical protein